MPDDPNDVVRHVILRVLVDADTLGAQMGKARAQLKSLEESEKQANQRRAKSFEQVNGAVGKYNDALKDSEVVGKRVADSSVKSAKDSADSHERSAKAVKEETSALVSQGKEADRQAAAKQKRDQDLLNSEQARGAKERASDDAAAARAHKHAAQDLKDELTLDALSQRVDDEKKQRDENHAAATAHEHNLALARVEKLREEARKTAAQVAAISNKGDNDREIKKSESTAGVSRRDRTSDAGIARADQNAEATRLEAKRRNDAAIVRQNAETMVKIENADKVSHAKRANAQRDADTKFIREARKTADELLKSKATVQDAIDTTLAVNAGRRATSTSQAGTAGYREQAAASGAQNALDKTLADSASRRAKSMREQETHQEKQKILSTQQIILEQRALEIVDRRARAEEKATTSRVKGMSALRQTLTAGILDPLRAAAEASPDPRPSRTRQVTTSFDESYASSRERGGGRVSSAARGIRAAVDPSNLTRGVGPAISLWDRLTDRIGAAHKALKSEGSGGGGGFGRTLQGLSGMADGLLKQLGPLAKTMFSFRGVILAVVTAFGPLVAMMGAVGGAALGLVSNLVALSGSLLALPGLIGAAVGAFGALAVVMGPVSGAFKAFGAAQKAASDGLANGGKAARDAANALVDAQRAVQDAERDRQRAIEDAPRAERRLSDARKQAARDIQDYRLQLQKLRHDQEGAELGVESAMQAYRRALADPTANNLDRKQARHDVVGAMFDQRDQQVSQGRLIEDANQAERRGVEGSDAVIDAKRGIEDANRALEDSITRLTRANEDLHEAQLDQAAGGAAARKANDALEAELAKLGPKTRKVVEEMLALNGSFKEMQKRVSEKMFGPLSEDTDKFADVLKSLEEFLTPAAEALGELGHQAITLFTNPEWKKFFSEQGEESGYIIGQLGEAALAAADGFRSLIEVARPFTRWVVDGIKGMAESFQDFATSEDGRKKIGDFLELSKKRMQELWPVVKDIAAGFAGFFKALNTPFKDDNGKVADFTTRINEGLGGMAKTFRELGEKASDPNGGFMKWLKDIGPLLTDVKDFIAELAESFGTMASDPDNLKEASAILEKLTDEILPALVKIFDEISESGGVSSLLDAFGSALQVLSDFLDNGGTTTLTVFFKALEGLGETIEFLSEHIPGFNVALAAMSTILAGMGALAIFAKLAQLDKLVKLGGFLRDATKGGGGITGVGDAVKDKLSGREVGTTTDRRAATKANRGVDLNSELPQSARGASNAVLTSLGRIEGHLRTLIGVMRACCAGGGPGGKGTRTGQLGKDGTSGPKPPYQRGTAQPTGIEGDAPSYGRRPATSGSMPDLTREGTSYGDISQYGTEQPRRERTTHRQPTRSRGRGLGGLLGGIIAGGAASSLLGGGASSFVSGGEDYDPVSLVDPGMVDMGIDPRRQRTTIAMPEEEPPATRPAARPRRPKGIASILGKTGKGLPGRLGGSLARGAVGGIGGIAASVALTLGGDAAINRFVKNDEDAASASRGLGAVATGAGIGGLVGSVVPGIGTAIGAGVGAAAGGVYSLAKDKNLRSFVGDKISGGAAAVGGAASEAGGAIRSIFTGEDSEGKKVSAVDRVKTAASVLTPVGAAIARSDVGKSIGGKLQSAAGSVGDFAKDAGKGLGDFAKDAGSGFNDKVIDPVKKFFSEDLPEMPEKFFHAFFRGTGKLLAFFVKDLPRKVKELFTETIPDLGKDAWEALQKNLFDPMVEFITVTVPAFFTETIPDWFDSAGEFLQEDVMEPIYQFINGIPAFFTETIPTWFDSLGDTLQTKVFDPVKNFVFGIPAFFTETIPQWFASLPDWFATHVKDPLLNFFTVTLPNTFKAIPGFLFDNFAKPIGNFFSGLAGHVGDFLTGSWDWVKSVFSSATADVKEGYESGDPKRKMSGGVIEGVYSGIEDHIRVLATPGEFMVRRGVVEQPGAKAFLQEFNEGRINPAQFYAGLSAQATPKVMSLAPVATSVGGGVVHNSSADNSRSADFAVRDITINNPVRERSERSMRRALQIAAIRHRR